MVKDLKKFALSTLILFLFFCFAIFPNIHIGYCSSFTLVEMPTEAPANTNQLLNATISPTDSSIDVQLRCVEAGWDFTKGTMGGTGKVSFDVHYPDVSSGSKILTVTLTTLDAGGTTITRIITVKAGVRVELTAESPQSCEPAQIGLLQRDVSIRAKFVDTTGDSAVTVTDRKVVVYDISGNTQSITYSSDPIPNSGGEYLYIINFFSQKTGQYKFEVYAADSSKVCLHSFTVINMVPPRFFFKIIVGGIDQNKYIGKDQAMIGISEGTKTIELFALTSKYDILSSVTLNKVTIERSGFTLDITEDINRGKQNASYWKFDVTNIKGTVNFVISAETYYASMTEQIFQISTYGTAFDWLQILFSLPVMAIIGLIALGVILVIRKRKPKISHQMMY